MFRSISVFSLSLFLSACVFVPATAQKQAYYDKCKMATKRLTIEPKVRSRFKVCDGKGLTEEPVACLLLSGLVGTATFIVSGSVVAIGNTVHWLEYKSGCTPKPIRHRNKSKTQDDAFTAYSGRKSEARVITE